MLRSRRRVIADSGRFGQKSDLVYGRFPSPNWRPKMGKQVVLRRYHDSSQEMAKRGCSNECGWRSSFGHFRANCTGADKRTKRSRSHCPSSSTDAGYRPTKLQSANARHRSTKLQPANARHRSTELQPADAGYRPTKLQPTDARHRPAKLQPAGARHRPTKLQPAQRRRAT